MEVSRLKFFIKETSIASFFKPLLKMTASMKVKAGTTLLKAEASVEPVWIAHENESPLNPSWFSPKRLVGVGKASFISLAAPFIDDNAPAKKTAWLLAMFCMCISGSFALGYGYGGYVGGHFNWRYALWVEAILMLPFAILGFVMKPLQLKGFPPVESKEALTSVDTVASETEEEENMVKSSVKDSALNPSWFTPQSPIKQISFQDQECCPKQKTAIQYSDDEDNGLHTRLTRIMKLPMKYYADEDRYKLTSATFIEYKSELEQISLQERRRKQMELRYKQMELRRKQMPARQYSDDEDYGEV